MIRLLEACMEDTDEILKAKKDAWVDEVKLYGNGPDNYLYKEAFLSLFQTHRIFKIVIDSDTEKDIIGAITCVNTGNNEYYIGSVFVKLEYQNQKAGTEAMQLLFEKIPEAVLWKLNTPYLSFRNQHFYEKLGFKKVGVTRPDESGFYLIHYEKRRKEC